MNRHQEAALLVDLALDAGFDRAGATPLEPLEHGSALVSWLAGGHQAGMHYMARRLEVRLDPGQVFEGARSAVCVALQYPGGDPSSPPTNDLWGGVARYARGRDYHDVMGRMLGVLSERIRGAFPGCQTRWYVDTGPVLERELAALAGLGAIGKNTCLLHPVAGSWFFIGEIFTTLELARGTPLADLCGSCSRCLESCPTGALTEPFHLDSNRCISYWTIEHRGAIPESIRPQLEGWVFGCDVCQEACPLNEGQPVDVDPVWSLESERASLDLAGLLALDVETYRRLFRGSPMKRTKLAGLKRNAAVAMGNSGNRRYVSALVEALANVDPMVRRHVAWALGRLGGDIAREALASAASREAEPEVRAELGAALDQAKNAS